MRVRFRIRIGVRARVRIMIKFSSDNTADSLVDQSLWCLTPSVSLKSS